MNSPIAMLRKAQLPSLPDLIFKLQDLIEQEADFESFSILLQTDVSLGARILKIANSAYYTSGRQITDLEQAIGRIGTNKLIEIIMSSEFVNYFDEIDSGVFDMNTFWQESLYMAIMAEKLSLKVNTIKDQDQSIFYKIKKLLNINNKLNIARLYTLGLLCNIGTLISAIITPNTTQKIIETCRAEKLPRDIVEKKIGKHTHAETGSSMLLLWGFPASFYVPISLYLTPEQAPSQHQEETAILNLAYFLRLALHDKTIEHELHNPYTIKIIDSIQMDSTELIQLSKEVEQNVSAMLTVLA